MTKSTITRERLQELAAGQSGFNLRIATHEESQELARMALAAMDSEPVGEFYEDGPLNWYQISDGDRVPSHRRIPLYRHAQPVPLEFANIALPHSWLDGEGVEVMSANEVKRACRAAMLASYPQLSGSDPATVPGKWIPVGERMPPSRHEVLVGRWWGEKPRWCCKWATYIPGHPDALSSGWLIPGGSWTPTHWMELPAAPQEVKGE